LLYEITRSEFGTVNGAHHQNVDPNAVGNNLKVNAYSEGEKNMIERLDFKGQPNKAFMLCVQ